jgi:hypothetical protein
MPIYKLIKLKNNRKKFAVVLPNNRIIKFGASGYQDYTMHHDTERKRRYIKRHQARENWNNISKAGTWSRYILWEKKNINDAIDNMENLFGITIET